MVTCELNTLGKNYFRANFVNCALDGKIPLMLIIMKIFHHQE